MYVPAQIGYLKRILCCTFNLALTPIYSQHIFFEISLYNILAYAHSSAIVSYVFIYSIVENMLNFKLSKFDAMSYHSLYCGLYLVIFYTCLMRFNFYTIYLLTLPLLTFIYFMSHFIIYYIVHMYQM